MSWGLFTGKKKVCWRIITLWDQVGCKTCCSLQHNVKAVKDIKRAQLTVITLLSSSVVLRKLSNFRRACVCLLSTGKPPPVLPVWAIKLSETHRRRVLRCQLELGEQTGRGGGGWSKGGRTVENPLRNTLRRARTRGRACTGHTLSTALLLLKHHGKCCS